MLQRNGGGLMNILIVDDQERILKAMTTLVDWRRLGIEQVYIADSAAKARDILEKTSVDIMLTDIEMPGEDGISLQKWQAEKYPYILCIFLTSHADFAYAREAIRNGAFDYILQPADIKEIEEVVERCTKHLEARKQILQRGNQFDDKIPVELSIPDATSWGKWMVRKDSVLVKNQIVNLLRYAEREGYLTEGYMQRIIRRFLEACSIACYAQNKTLADLFTRSFTYEKMLHSYSSVEELCRSVDFCIRQYRMIIMKENGDESSYTAQERIQDILHYLEDNMDRMISRREAAKYVFLNEDYFSRIFRKEMGMGYKEYVLKQKMDYAEKLLENTGMPVTLIASRVGYDNFTNFTQMFRKYTGETPTDYRKHSRKSGNKDGE